MERFGPEIREVKNSVREDKISMQIYNSSYYQKFNPENEFEKWAALEVQELNSNPKGVKPSILEKNYIPFLFYAQQYKISLLTFKTHENIFLLLF